MLHPERTAVTYERPAVPRNSAVPSCTSISEIEKSISCVLVCGLTSPFFQVADVAAGNRHFRALTVVRTFGGSDDWPCASDDTGIARRLSTRQRTAICIVTL